MFLIPQTRCIILPEFELVILYEVFAMSPGVEDLQMLRLIKAFQKLTGQDARRLVLSSARGGKS
ncbi:hypothetical protein XI06_14880 [Bradyrhizobium sp. CCBAU 11434]|nr:hypothetical protein [Bradyrhizobium sp. CCBAU 11434]